MASIDAESDCEPDSQQDNCDLLQNEGSFDELHVSPLRTLNTSLATSNQSVDDSSFSSQKSSGSQSIFKKVPTLNKILERRSSSSTCKGCTKVLNTREIPRLMTHVRKCQAIDSQLRLEIVTEYENLNVPIDRHAILNEKWARFMVENNVPLQCVSSKSFIDFMTSATNGWRWASRQKYSHLYIPALSRSIKNHFMTQVNSSENMLTVEFDHWSDIVNRSFLGVVFTFSDGKRYLQDLMDVSLDGHSARKTVTHLLKALESMPSTSINSIVSDSASACRLTRELIVEHPKYKRVIQYRCIAHLLNRMGLDFTGNEYFKDTLVWANRVTAFVTYNAKLLAQFRSECQRRPRKVCNVRWYSTIDMMESLLDCRQLLMSTVNSFPERTRDKYSWIDDRFNWTHMEKAVKVLRPIANCIAISERQTGSLGEAVSSILRYACNLFFSDWSEPLTVAAITSFLTYFGPNKLGEEEFALMLAAYVLDRRNKCDFITEEGLDLAFQAITTVALKSGCTVNIINILLLEEYSKFCNQKGQFSRNQPACETAAAWWAKIGPCSTLRQIATRIVRLTSSSANIERTFSSLKWFQGSRRTNLSSDTLTHLTRIRIYQETTGDQQKSDDSVDENSPQDQQSEVSSMISDSTVSVEEDESFQIRSKDNFMPEMFTDVDTQTNFERFTKFVDFTLVNELNLDPNESQAELSIQEMEELKSKCRMMRQRERVTEELRDHPPAVTVQDNNA